MSHRSLSNAETKRPIAGRNRQTCNSIRFRSRLPGLGSCRIAPAIMENSHIVVVVVVVGMDTADSFEVYGREYLVDHICFAKVGIYKQFKIINLVSHYH